MDRELLLVCAEKARGKAPVAGPRTVEHLVELLGHADSDPELSVVVFCPEKAPVGSAQRTTTRLDIQGIFVLLEDTGCIQDPFRRTILGVSRFCQNSCDSATYPNLPRSASLAD